MSFLVAAALAVALLVVIPLAAHLLRRGRSEEREFPPASLVPTAPPVARRRSRVEDWVLLVLRGALIVALAVLGAVPFVRCSRLSLTRDAGGSVALALVLDDSLSMRLVTPGGGTRWDRARAGARELLASAREGDAISLVLAGTPARLALAATTDVGVARRALDEVSPADRSTDLASAVQLARSSLEQLPHADKRVVLLSDLAGDAIPRGPQPASAPLEELREPVANCGVVSAEQRGRRVSVTVACSSANAARDRTVTVSPSEGARPEDASASAAPVAKSLGEGKLRAEGGLQTIVIEIGAALVGLDVQLGGEDACSHDDVAPVAPEQAGLTVGVVVDPARASVMTGGATVVEQALSALERPAVLRPLPLVPDDAKELENVATLVIDDPPGVGPEARAALSSWLERGGVALALLGPQVESVQLGSSLLPFAEGALRWTPTGARGLDPASLGWLGGEAASLSELGAKSRVELDGSLPPGGRVVARWDDGQAFVIERSAGRGLVTTAGLPASVDLSDLALRPGFLALLEHVIEQAARRTGQRISPVGTLWSFPDDLPLRVEGPEKGRVIERDPGHGEHGFVPDLRGRYRVTIGDRTEERIATLDAQELLRRPLEPDEASGVRPGSDQAGKVDASSQAAILVLALFAAELAARLALRARRRTRMSRH